MLGTLVAVGWAVSGGGGAAPFLVLRLTGFTGTGDSDPPPSGWVAGGVGEVGGGGAA